ncbi:MAG: YjbH domain-containing protein, partial [Desulfobacteraceae bacterium]
MTLPIHIASASDKPFNGPANWGGSGLFEIPNARVLDDGDMRLGYAHIDPYRQLVLNLGLLPRVEFNLRYTEIDDIPSGLGSDFGDYKDKAFDVKLQLVKESRRFPAIAVGFQDFHGTKLFRAQYLTINRQIYPLDFTLGFGRERLKGPAELPYWDEIGVFGGIEWAINDRISAALEYSPVEYEKDPLIVRTTDESATSPWNVGLKFKVTSAFSLGLSYQRGDTIGLTGHLTFSMGKPILPKRPDPPSWNFLIHDPQYRPSDEQVVQGAVQDINNTNNFSNVSVIKLDRTIICSVQNDHYLSNTKAVGRVMRILLRYAGPDTGRLTVNLSRRGIDVLSVSAAPHH